VTISCRQPDIYSRIEQNVIDHENDPITPPNYDDDEDYQNMLRIAAREQKARRADREAEDRLAALFEAVNDATEDSYRRLHKLPPYHDKPTSG